MTDRVLCICGHAQDEHWRGTDGCKHSCACGKFRHASSNREAGRCLYVDEVRCELEADHTGPCVYPHATRNRVEPCPECGSRLDVHPSTCSRSVPGRLHAAPKYQAERWDCNLTLLGTHAEVEAWFIKLHDDYGDMIEGGFLGPEKDDE